MIGVLWFLRGMWRWEVWGSRWLGGWEGGMLLVLFGGSRVEWKSDGWLMEGDGKGKGWEC